MGVIQLLQGFSRTRHNGRTRRETFQTVAMEGTHTLEARIQRVPPWVDMADFRMHEAMNRYAAHQDAAADSGADGQIRQVFEVSSHPPSMLCQSRCVGVRV